jgi:hypothetical protein
LASAPLTIETPVAAGFSPGPGLPILTLSAPAKVLDLLALHCHGWERGPGGEPAAVRCIEDAEGFVIEAAVLPLGRYRAESAFEAADVAASALAASSVGGAGVILPHAAALQSPAGLVLLFADTMGGKSTLALTLVAAGWRLFGDDRLALRRAEGRSIGTALGLAAKLRLPVPTSAWALAEFANRRIRARWPSRAYLALGPEEQARAGTAAAVAACLLLDRSGGEARLELAQPAQLVHALAESAAAPWLGPVALLAAAAAHAPLPVWRLRYGEAPDAARLVQERFAEG